MVKRPVSRQFTLYHEATMLSYANSLQEELAREQHAGLRFSASPYVVPLIHYLPASNAQQDGLVLQLYDASLRDCLTDLTSAVDKLKIITRLTGILRFLNFCKRTRVKLIFVKIIL